MRAFVPMLLAVVQLSAQSDQAPVFRSGVEVMEVDVTVVDGAGMPIRDLRAPEFTVTIDGQPRRIMSVEFVAEGTAPSTPQAQVRDPYVSTNTGRRPGRLLMLVIDRNNIDTQTIRQSIAPLRNFLGSLAPDDRVALVTIPSPGPSVDFTTSHEQTIDALGRIIGMEHPMQGQFDVSDYEALTLDNGFDPLAVQSLLSRVCGNAASRAFSNCVVDVQQEAATLASQIRQSTAASVSALAALLKNLRDVDGPKSLIVLSQGLMLEGTQSDAAVLAQMAADARVNVNVLLFDTPIGVASQGRVLETSGQDRDLREAGLEAFASRSRGSLFRVVANPQSIFNRLRSEMSAYYMLGVEPVERDRDGKPHQIRVQVRRTGAQVRSRRQVQYTARTPNTSSHEMQMERILRSPSPSTKLPMRLSSYVYRDTVPGKIKLVLAAEIDPESMDKGLDLGIGFGVFDRSGNVVASGHERKIYSPNSDVPILYTLTLPLDPGTYRVKLAAIDLGGNSGSVERDIDAFRMEQELAFGDLILARIRNGEIGELRPPVVLQVVDGQFGTYTELYTSKPGSLDDTRVVFEVADTEDGPTLQSAIGQLRERTDRTMRQAFGVMPVGALPPGRYIARAIISSSGKTVGKLLRPFDVLPTPRAAASIAPKATVAPAAMTGVVIIAKPSAFKREDVLTPEMLRAVFDAMDKHHPAAKAALARARTGKLDGTALMALDAGDQSAGSIFRGLEFLSKGQLDPAANQFSVALRDTADSPVAAFYLGACYAAAGKDREAVASWERARAAKLELPGMQVVIADGWLRLGQPAQALEPLREALNAQPQNDDVRKNLAVAQSNLGLYEQSYPTIVPFLERNPSDTDALLVALHALYQARVEGKTIGSAEQDRARAAAYARAYAEAKGPLTPLVEKWADVLSR